MENHLYYDITACFSIHPLLQNIDLQAVNTYLQKLQYQCIKKYNINVTFWEIFDNSIVVNKNKKDTNDQTISAISVSH